MVAPFGLSHAQYSALASLHQMSLGGAVPTQRELADYTGLQPIFVSKLVRALEAAGHIARTDDPRDSRAVRLTLTAIGAATIADARRLVAELDRRLTAPIGGPDGDAARVLASTLQLLLDQPRDRETRQ